MNDITIGLDQADGLSLATSQTRPLRVRRGVKKEGSTLCFLHCFRSLPRSIKSASPLPLKIRIA
jgi:hypothetical protein